MGVEIKHRYRTPGPGAYDVRKASRQCLKSAPAVAFGGCLNRVDRGKTGPLKVVGDKSFVPGPCSYAVEAEDQARELCERPQALAFGRASREDISKLFLGKEAVAYVISRTPGPGTYELRWQRPCSLFPSREPGTCIGGPFANVDRTQTGPLGPSYKSFTPGPGAYDSERDHDYRMSPIRLRPSADPSRHGSTGSILRARASKAYSTPSESETESRVAGREDRHLGDAVSQEDLEVDNPPTYPREVEDDGGSFTRGSSIVEGSPGANAQDPGPCFSLSPFRFVDQQLPLLGRPSQRPITMRTRRNGSRSPPRRTNGSKTKKRAFRSSESLQASGSNSSCGQLSSIGPPVSTFGTGTREQAGRVLAPGFKGYAPKGTLSFPGPGAYCNFRGSLGDQVVSTLYNSASSSFCKGGRGSSARDAGMPGPGAYRSMSSLGSQVSSTRATAPVPKFGTSLRRALEDGLVG